MGNKIKSVHELIHELNVAIPQLTNHELKGPIGKEILASNEEYYRLMNEAMIVQFCDNERASDLARRAYSVLAGNHERVTTFVRGRVSSPETTRDATA